MLSFTKNRRGAIASAVFIGLAAVLSAPQVRAEEVIKVGTLATLEGPFTILGQDGMRGFNLALKEVNGMVAGKKIQVIQGSSDASPDSAVKAARKLVEQDGVSILIGPLSGDEGLGRQRLCQNQTQCDLYQWLIRRPRHHLARSRCQFLSLFNRGGAMDVGTRRLRLHCEEI